MVPGNWWCTCWCAATCNRPRPGRCSDDQCIASPGMAVARCGRAVGPADGRHPQQHRRCAAMAAGARTRCACHCGRQGTGGAERDPGKPGRHLASAAVQSRPQPRPRGGPGGRFQPVEPDADRHRAGWRPARGPAQTRRRPAAQSPPRPDPAQWLAPGTPHTPRCPLCAGRPHTNPEPARLAFAAAVHHTPDYPSSRVHPLIDTFPGALRTTVLCLATAVSLGGCGTFPEHLDPDEALLHEAMQGTGSQRPPVDPASEQAPVDSGQPQAKTPPQRQLIRGNQQFVRAPSAAPAGKEEGAGDIVFNFADQPIEAVINSVMGDLLHENYTIAQGVKGNVSFSTSKPVNKQQALSILETLLSWTDNSMIKQGNRYVILPANQAVAGKLVPEMRVSQPSSGLSARLFPLRYISATEMQKLLKPFARENAFLLVDPARNLLSLAGTPEELANYQDTIDTFDVDWLKGMSVGVFGLQRASVAELMPELQKMFGPDSGMPLAGMVRFLPIERTNSVVAISSQPQYLSEVGDWIHTIDEGGGNEPQMYVYDVRNMKATDLAKYLRQIYGTGAIKDDTPAKVAPGLRTATLSSPGTNSTSGSTPGGLSNNLNNNQPAAEDEEQAPDAEQDDAEQGATEDAPAKSLDAGTRITAQKSSNQLLVRTRPVQWKEIESAIKRLDNPPLQVQIETRILEVKLTGELDLGVQWYLGRLAGNSTSTTVGNTAG
ncbi:hypothetical protein ALQ38_05517, partial [Pseudomonas marginalis pv. marginalis]